MNDTRARRLRALRHLPVAGAVSAAEADRLVGHIVSEVPELARGDAAARLAAHLVSGDKLRQIGAIVDGSSRRRTRELVVGAILALSLPAVLIACLALAAAGKLAAIGVAVTAWIALAAIAGRIVGARWGCVPRRHAKLVEQLVDAGAVASAWSHYRAARGCALDDDAAMAPWGHALVAIAAVRHDHERLAALRHDCVLLEAIGDRAERQRARTAARRLGVEEEMRWRL